MLPLEYTKPQDQYYDYCLWEYQPPSSPKNKLRSINLLRNSLNTESIGAIAEPLLAAIRQGFGESKTVWGIKLEQGRISWELYFYDYGRLQRQRSIPKLLDIIKPWISCNIPSSEEHDYFMFSIDLNQALIKNSTPLDEIQMYIGNVGSLVSSGICYALTKTQATLKNFYFFFDAKKQMNEIIGKISSSVYLNLSHLDINAILWPELRDCQTIVVANKHTHDGIYFSRINVEQLLFFLKIMCYPDSHIAFVTQHREQLNHLMYDVGFDYRMEGNRLIILKSAYYGVF